MYPASAPQPQTFGNIATLSKEEESAGSMKCVSKRAWRRIIWALAMSWVMLGLRKWRLGLDWVLSGSRRKSIILCMATNFIYIELGQKYNQWINTMTLLCEKGPLEIYWLHGSPVWSHFVMVSKQPCLLSDALKVLTSKGEREVEVRAPGQLAATLESTGASGQLPDARGCVLLQCFMPL